MEFFNQALVGLGAAEVFAQAQLTTLVLMTKEKSIQEIMVGHATRDAAVGVRQGGVVFDEHDPPAGRQPRCDSLGIAQHLVVDHRLSHQPGNKAGLGIQREDAAQRIDQKYLPDAGVLLNRGIDRLVGGCGRPP